MIKEIGPPERSPTGYLGMIRMVGETMKEAQTDATLTKNNKALFTNMYQSVKFATGHRLRVNNDNIIKELNKAIPNGQTLTTVKDGLAPNPIPFGVTYNLQKTIELEANNKIPNLQGTLDGITSGTTRTSESTVSIIASKRSSHLHSRLFSTYSN